MITAMSLNGKKSMEDYLDFDLNAIEKDMVNMMKPKFKVDRNFLPGVELIDEWDANNKQTFEICSALAKLRQESDMPEELFQKFEDLMYEGTPNEIKDVENTRKRTRKHGFGTISGIRID